MDPDALLGINEARFESDVGYGSSGAYLGERGRSVFNLTQALLEAGVPIHYVGAQGPNSTEKFRLEKNHLSFALRFPTLRKSSKMDS